MERNFYKFTTFFESCSCLHIMHSEFQWIFRRVKIEYNIKEIATQTKPITFVRLYVYKYRVKTLKLKTLHVYFNLNSKYTNCSFILLAVIVLRTQSCADDVYVTKSYYDEMLLFIFLVLIKTLNGDMRWVKYLINQKFKLVFSWKSDELCVLFLRAKGCNITFIFKIDLN